MSRMARSPFVLLVLGGAVALFCASGAVWPGQAAAQRSRRPSHRYHRSRVTANHRLSQATGTWVGPLPIGTAQRVFTLQLHQRDQGDVLGTVLGGTSQRTIVAGQVTGRHLHLELEFKDPLLTRHIAVDGRFAGDEFRGTATDGSAQRRVHWRRARHLLYVKRFVFGKADANGNVSGLTEVAVVLNRGGRFVSGGYVGVDSCDTITCGGGVTSFSEHGDSVTMGLETAGTCVGTGMLQATYDPATHFYTGSYQMTLCDGAHSGALMGGQDMGTRSDAVGQILAALGHLGDDLEADRPFAAPYLPLAPDYLHWGALLADRLTELNDEEAHYSGLQVHFERIRAIATVLDPRTYPALQRPFGFQMHELDTGVPIGGGAQVTVLDLDSEQGLPEPTRFTYVAQQKGRWVIHGNQHGAFHLPFVYSVGTDSLLLPVGQNTAYPGTVYASVGGFGAHFGPLSGHPYGDSKSNLVAYYVHSERDLTELKNGNGGTQGQCDPELVHNGSGEVCGFLGGSNGEIIRARIPTYIAPDEGQVTQVVYYNRPSSDPAQQDFDNVPQWTVRLQLDDGVIIDYGHLGHIVEPLHSRVLATTGVDTDTFTPNSTDPSAWDYCQPGILLCNVDVLRGATVPMHAGENVAQAQVVAAPVPGFAGYYYGQIGTLITPWAPLEFKVYLDQSISTCVYALLPPAVQAKIQGVITQEMSEPDSNRYRHYQAQRWQWSAEGLACNGDNALDGGADFSSIHSQLGGWFQRPSPGVTPKEILAIVPVRKQAPIYDPSLYDVLPGGQPPDYLILRAYGRAPANDAYLGTGFQWIMPNHATVTVYGPTGEVLELTGDSMLIEWRDVSWGSTGAHVVFQRAAYALDSQGLKVKWGAFAATAAGAVAPTLDPAESCDSTTVLCYDHSFRFH